MSSYTVNVSNIAPTTTEAHLNDFFTFCGKILTIDFKETEPKTAVVHFEKPSAAKTALMLNGGTLDGSHLIVSTEAVHPDDDDAPHADGAPYHQSDKPRAGIAAEYLAKGYTLSDSVLSRAIEIDSQQGISKRFLKYIQSLDKGVGARALGPDQTVSGKVQSTIKSVDEQRGISQAAADYYSKALSTSIGQKVFSFYTSTAKQVLDIHEEARRIADQGKSAEQASEDQATETPIVTTTNTTNTTVETAPGAFQTPPTASAPTVI